MFYRFYSFKICSKSIQIPSKVNNNILSYEKFCKNVNCRIEIQAFLVSLNSLQILLKKEKKDIAIFMWVFRIPRVYVKKRKAV